MGTGYTRADVSNNIADGNIINSSDLDNEYDAIEAAFNSSTGHTHDGTSAEGGPITVVGPVQDLVVSTTEVKPKTTNTLDIGTGSLQFKDLHLDGTAYLDDVQAVGAVDITGDLDVDNINIDGNTIISTDTNGDINISPDGTGTVVIDTDLDVDNININGNTISSTDTNGNITLAPDGTGVVALSSTDLTFGDNDKAIFGAGSDLQIYHDGSNSRISDQGTGNLIINAGEFRVNTSNDAEAIIKGNQNGDVELYYNGVEKLATTFGGIDVTGTVTADGLAVDGYATITDTNVRLNLIESDATDLNTRFQSTGGEFYLRTITDDLSSVTSRLKVDHSTGDISFYDNTGVTQGFFWDASTQRLGLGTTSPSQPVEIAKDAGQGATPPTLRITNTKADYGSSATTNVPHGAIEFYMSEGSGNYPAVGAAIKAINESIYAENHGLAFFTNSDTSTPTERLRIDSSGNVGIGTSPERDLHVKGKSGDPVHFKLEGDPADYARIMFDDGTTDNIGELRYNFGSDYMSFNTNSSERMRIDSSGDLLVGKTAVDSNVAGFEVVSDGKIAATRSNAQVAIIHRLSSDGTLVSFRQGTVDEGSISVSGTTVSYNGGHLSRWSQLADNTRDESILKGTVMTNLDQMAEWTNEGVTEDNEQLNCMAVSAVEGDPNVAGVFVNWDNDDDIYTNDMNIAMTGDMVIRIAQGTTVARGDLLMSAGDGTAKPQGDDIVRSKTIAKVTSTHISHTYDDGSYLVPCVLMAC